VTKHRAGRPRKAGPRQPCGHLKSSGAEPPSPAQIKRIQTGLLKSSTEQLLGDEVGRLYFHKLLTERQVSAAFRVADVYGREDRRSGAVVAIAWIPGFSSYETIATASLGSSLAAAAISLMSLTSR
jgi:hypothetical protein